MKKFVALLLALALVVTGIAAAMADYDMVASMKKWVDVDLGGYKVVQLFNYNESVAVNVGGYMRVASLNITRDGKTYYHIIPTGGANTVSWDHVEHDNIDIDPITGNIYDEDCIFVPINPTDASDAAVQGLLGAVDFGYDGLDLDWNGNGIADDGNSGLGSSWHYDDPNYGTRMIPEYYAVGEATRWIDNSVAKAETNPTGKTTPKDAAADVRYVISGTYVAGFEVGKEILDNGSTKNVVPVDLTVEENTVFVYPIATNSHVVIGLLFAKVNVEEGFVQIEVQYKDELYKDWGTTLEVFTTKAQLVDGGADYELAEPISIEEELGGAQGILISITGKVTYPTLFGNLKSGKRLAYQDYYRYEKWVKSYRTNLTAALALVPEE